MCKMTDLERAEARVRLLEGKLGERDREAKTTHAMVRLAHFYLIGYRSDSDSATHAKRVLANEIIASKERLVKRGITPAPTTGEDKSSE